MFELIIGIIGIAVFIVALVLTISARYKKCASNQLLVVYGKTRGDAPSRTIHGGGAFVWPVIQGFAYLDLTPITINIPLKNALSKQNIRINIPSAFTIAISQEKELMQNAAIRLLGLPVEKIIERASDIIFGQLRSVVSGLTIEEINADRDRFLEEVRKSVVPELEKLGLALINVNVEDITDDSKYLDSIGQKAAATVVNQALVDVAAEQKKGQIGKAENVREMNVGVAQQNAESVKGTKEADTAQRIFVQQKETEAVNGEKEAETNRRIFVQQKETDAVNGEKEAEAKRRIYVKSKEAEAIKGENDSMANIARYNAELFVKQAEARRTGEVANLDAEIAIQQRRQGSELEQRRANEVVPEQIAKEKRIISAEAEKEQKIRLAEGDAQSIKLKYLAEAEGIKAVLDAKADGYKNIIDACGGDPNATATLLMIEKLNDLVKLQTEAIKNIKFDNITVWDSGGKTAEFASSLIGSFPPLQSIGKMIGFKMPEYLGGSGNDATSVTKEK